MPLEIVVVLGRVGSLPAARNIYSFRSPASTSFQPLLGLERVWGGAGGQKGAEGLSLVGVKVARGKKQNAAKRNTTSGCGL